MKKRTKIITGVVIAGILAAASSSQIFKAGRGCRTGNDTGSKGRNAPDGHHYPVKRSNRYCGTIRHYLRNAESGGRDSGDLRKSRRCGRSGTAFVPD